MFRDGEMIYESTLSGDTYQFSSREIKYKNFIYPLEFDPAFSNYEIILWINTAGESFICPIRLMEKNQFYEDAHFRNFGSGLYFCLLSLFIISLFIFYRASKEKMLLYYMGYLSTLVLYLLDIEGLTNQFLFSKYPAIQSLEQPVLAGVLAFFFLQFSARFFNFKVENPSLYGLVKWSSRIILGIVILMPLILQIQGEQKKMILFSYLLVLLISCVSVYLFLAYKAIQSKKIRYYLFAVTFGIEAFGFTIHFMATHAISPDNFFTRNILMYASLLSLSFFTIYLIYIIDRISSNYKTLQLQLSTEKDKSFRNVLIGEELERARISKLLEEKISSKLSSAQNQLKSLYKSNEVADQQKKLKGINQDLDIALKNLSSMNQNSLVIHDVSGNLKELIEKDVHRVSNAYKNIRFDSIIDEIDHLGFTDFDQSVLFRIFEESLNNALKHSRATQIEIYLLELENSISLEIIDNGIGFQKDEQDSWGMGLKNIESRVNYLNGKFHLQSEKDRGTHFKILLPIKTKVLETSA